MKLSRPGEVPRPLRYPPCSSATHSISPPPPTFPDSGGGRAGVPGRAGLRRGPGSLAGCHSRRVSLGAGPAPPTQPHPVTAADTTPPPAEDHPPPPHPRPRASDPPLSRQAQLRSAALESCRSGPGMGEEATLGRPSGAGSPAQAAPRPAPCDVTSVSTLSGRGRLTHVALAPGKLTEKNHRLGND